MHSGDNRTLLKWGGICTYLSVIAFIASLGGSMMFGELSWKLWLPLSSIVTCLWVMVLLAGYEYLKKTHHDLAKVGAAFGALLIVVLFAEVAEWGAYKRVALAASMAAAASGTNGDGPSTILALINSTYKLEIWFHGLWLALWGAAFVRHAGREKVIGALMLAFAGIYALNYVARRLGPPELIEFTYSAGHVALILSHWMLAGVFLKASKSKGKESALG